jgi:hypothetical protein
MHHVFNPDRWPGHTPAEAADDPLLEPLIERLLDLYFRPDRTPSAASAFAEAADELYRLRAQRGLSLRN